MGATRRATAPGGISIFAYSYILGIFDEGEGVDVVLIFSSTSLNILLWEKSHSIKYYSMQGVLHVLEWLWRGSSCSPSLQKAKMRKEKAWILKQQQQRGLNTWPKLNLLGPHQDNQADCSRLTSTLWQKEIQGHHKKQPLSRPNPSYTDFLRREWFILNRIGHSAGQHSQVGASAQSPCIWRGTNNGPQACPHNSLKQD